MTTVTLEITEAQLIKWVEKLSPTAKQTVLKTLIPDLEQFEEIVDYGDQRIRELCAEQGINWEVLSETKRQNLIDEILTLKD